MGEDTRFSRAEALFFEALDRKPSDRAAFLRGRCGEERALLEEVVALLEAHEQVGDRIERVVEAVAGEMAGEADADDAGGRQVGQYRLVRRIALGGMGAVYLAERADAEYRRQVALKLVNRHLLNDEMTRRFRAERQILADLDHPNVARLLDGGTTEDGTPFIVMEHIDGVPIDDYAARERLGTRERLRLFLAVCDAVQYAHQNLVIHRDIKPSNILVTSDGTPKLLDFGIAKLLAPDADRTLAVTMAGERLMTPEHASPEQLRGEPVTTASDVYALGILLYQLLTGRRPYSLRGRSAAALERAICETDPLPPSTAVTGIEEPQAGESGSAAGIRRERPDRVARELSGDLDNIVLMALRKEPARRYPSADQLAGDLRRFLGNLPVTARPATLRYRAAKFLRRNAVAVSVAAGVTLLTLGLIGFYTLRLAAERDRALAAERRAVVEAETARQVSGFLTDLFRVSDPDRARGATITAREILDRGAERVRDELDDQPAVQAELMSTMGLVYRSLGFYEEARDLLERSYEIRREALGPMHEDTLSSLVNLGRILRSLGKLDEAVAVHRRALELQRSRVGSGHLDYAASAEHLAQNLARAGKLEEAERYHREAYEVRLAQLGEENRETFITLANLAYAVEDQGRFDEAEAMYREVLDIERRTLGENSRDVAITLNNLSYLLGRQSRYAEAERYLRESLAIRKAIFEPGHPSVTIAQSNMASILTDLGDYDEARALLEAAAASALARLGARHIDYAKMVAKQSVILEAEGHHAQAETVLREALVVYDETLGAGHQDTASMRAKLAETLAHQGRIGEAESLLRESLAMLGEGLGEAHPTTLQTATTLGILLTEKGELAESEALLLAARNGLERAIGPQHLGTATANHALGVLRLAQGDTASAGELLQAAYEVRAGALHEAHPQVLESRLALAEHACISGGFEEGAAAAARVLTAHRERLPDDHWQVARARGVSEACGS